MWWKARRGCLSRPTRSSEADDTTIPHRRPFRSDISTVRSGPPPLPRRGCRVTQRQRAKKFYLRTSRSQMSTTTINGRIEPLPEDPDALLIDVLRGTLRLTGTKLVCG